MNNWLLVLAIAVLIPALLYALWGRIVEFCMRGLAIPRARFFVSKMESFVLGTSVFDLGCGAGHIARELKLRGMTVRAFDIVPPIRYFGMWAFGAPCVKALSKMHNFPFQSYDGKRLPFLGHSFFDTVLLAFVLHHAKDPDALLTEAIRVSNGRLIILEDTFAEGKRTNWLFEWLLNLEFFGHDKTKSLDEWRSTFSTFGLTVVHEEEFDSRMFGGLFNPHHTLFVLEKKTN